MRKSVYFIFFCALSAISSTKNSTESDSDAASFYESLEADSPYSGQDTASTTSEGQESYWPFWVHLDKRPLPQWYDTAKIGIFVHWGLYSIPAYPHRANSEWVWYRWKGDNPDPKIDVYMKNNYGENIEYVHFANSFRAEGFDANEWAELFAFSGAKYVVLTTKHHDGYALFDSPGSNGFNSVKTGPNRDIVKELSTAVREQGMKFGVYYSLFEWFNKLYLADKEKDFTSSTYVEMVVKPDLRHLVNEYLPSVIWSDGEWQADDSYWLAPVFLAWLYNQSPVKDYVVVNDRWGNNTRESHGDFYNGPDKYNPHKIISHKWENAFTLDRHSWGYRQHLTSKQVLTLRELLETIVSTVSCGGNALINVGPMGNGTIPSILKKRLIQLGEWLAVNGEAIYDTSPWFYQKDSEANAWYTCRKAKYDTYDPIGLPSSTDLFSEIYVIFFDWPDYNLLSLKELKPFLRNHDQIVLIDEAKGVIKCEWYILYNELFIRLPHLEDISEKVAWTLILRTLRT